MNRSQQKLAAFLDFAKSLAGLSTCRRLQVGCAIVARDLTTVYSIGYNGPAAGEDNDSCSGDTGDCGCVHAEANAVAKLATADRDCLLITTTSPCRSCAGLIVNCGRVTAVIYDTQYRDPAGMERLRRAGLIVADEREALCERS